MCSANKSPLPEEREGGIVQQPVSQFDRTSQSYIELLDSLKSRIQQARTKAALSVNRELVLLYWTVGYQIVETQNREGWGTSMIDRLAADLRSSLPTSRGLSPRNLWRMRAFYLAYPVSEESLPQIAADLPGRFLPQAVAEIPWRHNLRLIQKVKDPQQRPHGNDRSCMTHKIRSMMRSGMN